MGPEVIQPQVVSATGGYITKVLRSDSANFKGFGELYASTVQPGVFRGWKVHTKMHSLLMVCSGEIQVHIVPEIGNCYSLNFGRFWLSRELLAIPPGVMFGFRAVGEAEATVMNFGSHPHEEGESMKFPDAEHICEWLN